MNHSRRDDWKRLLRVVSFSSREVFEEIRPPSTPILVPALFVLFSAFILWLPLYVLVFTGLLSIPLVGEPNLGIAISSWQDLLALLVPIPVAFMFVYVSGAAILAAWYFAIARYFRVDISWEHWFGFTCLTLVPMIVVPCSRLFIFVLASLDDPPLVLSIVVVVLFYLLPVLWTVSLTQQGLRVWTAKGRVITLLISVIPYVLYVLLSVQKVVGLMHAAFS
ncbi:MAG: hypothetical protein F4W92_09295 [Gammaproteobacteria bacterium]|nr:hypothetical protein [Gammaproteobacteria bacterium]